jgi:hypothetical protein
MDNFVLIHSINRKSKALNDQKNLVVDRQESIITESSSNPQKIKYNNRKVKLRLSLPKKYFQYPKIELFTSKKYSSTILKMIQATKGMH